MAMTTVLVQADGQTTIELNNELGGMTREQVPQAIAELQAWLDTSDGDDWRSSMERFAR